MSKKGPKFSELPKISKILIVGIPLVIFFSIIGSLTGEDDKKEKSSAPAAQTPAQPSATPSNIPAPPPAPETPEETINRAAGSVVDDRLKNVAFDAASGNAVVDFQISENLTTGMMVDGARMDSVDVAKAVCAAEPSVKMVLIGVYGDATDAYGNSSNEQVIRINLSRATTERINPDGMDWENFPNVADDYQELVRF